MIPCALAAGLKPAAAQSPAVTSLDNFTGEYTDPAEPDTPLSFYVQNGRLVSESDRNVPSELTQTGTTEFALPGSRITFRFNVDGGGRGISVVGSFEPEITYRRTGDPVHHVFHDYQRSEAMIPMRDGVKLHVVILKPADIAAPAAVPHPAHTVRRGRDHPGFVFPHAAGAGARWIYLRGSGHSRALQERRPVRDEPPHGGHHGVRIHKDPKAIDESTDAYDTVEWLLKNVAGNNGRAGFIGTSYPGFLAMAAGIDPHPAVKAISPQAPMIDVWMGDDFFHNGAFRQTYGYDYVYGLESSKESTDVSYGKDKSGKPRDGFDYFLERGSFEEDVKRSGSKMLPTWKLFLEHPAYDLVWSSRGVQYDLNTVAVPTLTVGGYYDQEDMYGPQIEYATLEPHDEKHENFLVLGPWRHGSWSSSSRHLGNLDYGEPIGKEFRGQIEAKFFAHYLKDEPGFDLEDTASFQTGSNTWKRYAHFPPKESAPTSLHLEGDGKLGWSDSPAPAKTTYVSDPANPVPYRHRPIQPTYSDGSQWFDWLTEDQRFVTGRPDVAVWKLPVLKKDLVVTGEVIADIFASTTGTDNDMVVKLIDEYPAD